MNDGWIQRREFLGASLALGALAAWRPRPRAADVEELVDWIASTPRDPALQRAARELRAGLDPAQLLGALLVSAARDIRTDRPGFNHAALAVSAIDQLGAGQPRAARERAALWCLDYFKDVQAAEARSDDWRMQPLEAGKLPTGAKARAALVDAFERWDRDAADLALAGWVRSAPLDEVYALVWEYGLRSQSNLGHKGIYAAYSRRALPLAGERFAEDVLRSVVSSFFLHGRADEATPFEESRKLASAAVAAHAPLPPSDTGPARELLAALRKGPSAELPAAVAKLLAGGAAASSLWDAILVAASEVTIAGASTASVHALTSANSLHHIARSANDERIARLALMQAAVWISDFERRLQENGPTLRIESLEPAEATVDAVLAAGPADPARTKGALWLGAHQHESFLARVQQLVPTKADDVHEFKPAAAALEEARLVGEWARPWVCAAAVIHLPASGRADSTQLQRIRDALAVAAPR